MELWNAIEPYVINFIPVAIIIVLVLTFLRRKRARINWQSLAQRHGLKHLPPGPPNLFSKRAAVAFQDPGEVNGELDGLSFRLYVAIYGTSKDRRVFTIMSVEIPDVPAGLTIYRENAFLKFTKLLGAQDVTTGDPAFDAAFVVKGNDPARVSAWLDEPRRRAILRILGEDSDIDIREGCLHFQRGQVVDNAEVLERALGRFKELIPYVKPR